MSEDGSEICGFFFGFFVIEEVEYWNIGVGSDSEVGVCNGEWILCNGFEFDVEELCVSEEEVGYCDGGGVVVLR